MINPRLQLTPNPVDFDSFISRAPERLELGRGYPGGNKEIASNLLDMSMECFGLVEIVKRAPKEMWMQAIREVYGE